MSLPKPDTIPLPSDKKPIDILQEIKAEIRVIKPAGWSRKAVSSYYRLKFALEIKSVIDQMVKDGEDKIYYYSKFCKHPYKFSPNTLYSYVYQALRFLKTETIEGIDRAYYLSIIDKVVTTRDPGVGVRMSFHGDIAASDVDMAPSEVVKKSEQGRLQDKITTWIEEASIGDKLEIPKLGLTDLEIAGIQESLAGTENFLIADISTSRIKIRKIA